MSIKISISQIDDPILDFGSPGQFSDPKEGLRSAGPFDLRFGTARRSQVNVGLVGPIDMVSKGLHWINRCKGEILSNMPNKSQYPNYPGFKSTFHAELNVNDLWTYIIPEDTLEAALKNKKAANVFKMVLDFYTEGFEKLAKLENVIPNIIICCLSDEIIDKCWSVQNDKVKLADKKKTKSLSNQLLLFSTMEEEIDEQEEDILVRDFRKAVKARAMKYGIPIQIGTNNLFVDQKQNQDASIRAWNSSIAIYYKSGGIPWRLRNDGPETCYVGISFHHLYTTHNKHLVRSCIAQAFSSDGEGFAIRGVNVPWTEEQGRNVHLTFEQSVHLGEKILEEYRYRTGSTPLRMVLHKSTVFNDDEKEGLYSSLNNVPIVELVHIAPTEFRLVQFGDYPPRRGTFCQINNDANFLFTTGFMPEIKTYPGPHIPVPIKISVDRSVNIEKCASDIIALSRVNWNTASITGGHPVTLLFSRMVGGIMAEYGDENPPSSFRFYI